MSKVLILSFAMFFFVKTDGALSTVQKAKVRAHFLSVGLECVREYPLSPDDLKSFKAKKMPDAENAKCFSACLFKKIGLMDDKGKLSTSGAVQSAKKTFGEDGQEQVTKTEQLVTECSSVNMDKTSDGERGCDRAKLAFECLSEKGPKYGFNFAF